MKRMMMALMAVLMGVMLAACGGKSDSGNKDGDEEEETSGSFDMKQFDKLYKQNCSSWTEAEWLAWHKKKAQMLTDFYKSDPSVSDWLDMRNMENAFLQNANGYSQYYDRDDEADKLEAKLKKVYTKWKKAHAEELAQTTTMEEVPVEDPEEYNDCDEDIEPSENISMTYEVDITEDTKVESKTVEENKTVEEKLIESPKAQGNESEDNETHDIVEEMPHFNGDLTRWLSDHMESQGKSGRVICQFVVEKDGSISNAKVLKSDDPVLNDAALRTINRMPRWTPGKQNGKPVKVRYTIPIRFAQ